MRRRSPSTAAFTACAGPPPPPTKSGGRPRPAPAAASSVACRGPSVCRRSTCQPWDPSQRSASSSRFREGTLCAAGFTTMSVSLRLSLPMAKYYARRGSDHKPDSRYHGGAPFRTECGWRLPGRMNEKIGIKRLDHVCWAVRKLDDALPLLMDLMGMGEMGRWQNEEIGFRG